MSGPDERRGTDGGEHPLDVDARFADIVAHFHDGEPAPPRVVDGGAGSGTASLHAGPARTDDPDRVDEDDVVDRVERDEPADDLDGLPGGTRPSPGSGEAASDWATRFEQAAHEDLAAHEERRARQEREARVAAEVDAAVERQTHRFVPEEPPPLPRPTDLPGRLAWGAVLLGPLALVLFALVWPAAPPWLVGSVVTAIVAGFGYLVWRLPRTRDREDGGDGAIV